MGHLCVKFEGPHQKRMFPSQMKKEKRFIGWSGWRETHCVPLLHGPPIALRLRCCSELNEWRNQKGRESRGKMLGMSGGEKGVWIREGSKYIEKGRCMIG